MASSSDTTFSHECKLKRMNSIVKFIQETEPTTLNLEGKNIDVDDLKELVKYLPNSKVTELILKYNNLANGMQELSEVLPKTGIKKLNVSSCELTCQDLFSIMEALKDTAISELFIQSVELEEDQLETEDQNRFISLVAVARLKIFDFDLHLIDLEGDVLFFKALPSTPITQIETCYGPTHNILNALFSDLCRSSLTDIFIECNEIQMDSDVFKKLSDNLNYSKLEKLTLKSNGIDDHALDILVDGLDQSKVVELNLRGNKIRGANSLGLRLKDTCIKKLNLSCNNLDQYAMFLRPDFLRCSSVSDLNVEYCHLDAEHFQRIMKSIRFSKVTHLNVGSNNLQPISISKFAEVVKDTNLEEVDFTGNNLSPDAFIVLAGCIKTSKLSQIIISNCLKYPYGGTLLPQFLGEVKGSSINSVVFRDNELHEIGARMLRPHLINITFLHLDLSSNKIGNGLISLAEHLKSSSLTHLNLNENEISDEGVEALAKNLPETQLIELNLSSNKITSRGAEALSSYLKDSSLLYLYLSNNKIENDGIETLARNLKDTFITVLDVSNNSEPGDWFLHLDAALWENKTAVYWLTSTFKQISPQTFGDSFHFDGNTSNLSVEAFLENCLQLNMNILQKPSAVKVLKEDTTVSFSKEEIVHLMSEDFPKQFSEFMGSRVEADTTQQVAILKSAEDKGLSKVVECLLLNRPSYLIEESLGILHPYVYKLLNKYNHPLFNADVEPDAKTKLINYFTECRDLEGATDVIRLLHGKRKQ